MILILFFCFAFFVSGPLYAQVDVTETQPMRFGTLVINPSGDILTLTPTGSLSSNSGSDIQGGHARGIFRFEGTENEVVFYSFSINDTLVGNGEVLKLENYTTSLPNPFIISGSGVQIMNVGAQLVIPPNLNGGSFSGAFMITVDNQ